MRGGAGIVRIVLGLRPGGERLELTVAAAELGDGQDPDVARALAGEDEEPQLAATCVELEAVILAAFGMAALELGAPFGEVVRQLAAPEAKQVMLAGTGG